MVCCVRRVVGRAMVCWQQRKVHAEVSTARVDVYAKNSKALASHLKFEVKT